MTPRNSAHALCNSAILIIKVTQSSAEEPQSYAENNMIKPEVGLFSADAGPGLSAFLNQAAAGLNNNGGDVVLDYHQPGDRKIKWQKQREIALEKFFQQMAGTNH